MAEKITVFLILVTAFIGGVQARIYYQQKTIMEGSSGQTDKLIKVADIQAGAATKNAASAASFAESADGINTQTKLAVNKFDRLAKSSENSITQAKQTLDSTIKLARLEQRAWVAVGKQTLQGLTLIVEITNSGKTPAFDVVMGSRAQHWCCDLHAEHRSVRVEPEKESKGMLVPGASVWLVKDMSPSLNPPSTVTPPEVYNPTALPGDWKEKTVHQVIGTVEYRDVFGTPHWTNFCLRTQGFPNLDKVNFCDGGNDADDNPEKASPKK